MTIPLKYEDVVAKLALERHQAESTLGELEDLVEKLNNALGENDALEQRLTVAEKRADLLEGLLKSGSSPTYAHCSAVMEALKPAAEPDHICEGCGSKGWTDNCAQCVPY